MSRKPKTRRSMHKPVAANEIAAPQPKNYSDLIVCALLLLAVFLVFRQTANYDFINFDDPDYV